MVEAMTAIPPYNLGFPGKDAQSQYYPGALQLQRQEIATVSRLMEQKDVYPENTRMRKHLTVSGDTVYALMIASTEDPESSRKEFKDLNTQIRLEGGDHKDELSQICHELRQAALYAANETQKRTLDLYIQSFETGDLNLYRSALELWVHDLAPKVEHIIGFIEPYRDPYGIRAEFEGLVAIADPSETAVLRRLVQRSDKFIGQLPWVTGQTENNGKGPFEKSLFEPPDFSSIHGKSARMP
jgi:dipeptidyl-peptidase-3